MITTRSLILAIEESPATHWTIADRLKRNGLTGRIPMQELVRQLRRIEAQGLVTLVGSYWRLTEKGEAFCTTLTQK